MRPWWVWLRLGVQALSQKNGAWKYSLIHRFTGGPDGDYPNGLTMDSKGNLYGTTTLGGTYNFGVVFEITP